MSVSTCVFNALSAFGRFRVITATRPVRSSRMVSKSVTVSLSRLLAGTATNIGDDSGEVQVARGPVELLVDLGRQQTEPSLDIVVAQRIRGQAEILVHQRGGESGPIFVVG